jgi:hypothetical protein
VVEVERRVDLVEDVDGRRLEAAQREHERQREQRALAAGELGQGLLPHAAKRDAHLEACFFGRFGFG